MKPRIYLLSIGLLVIIGLGTLLGFGADYAYLFDIVSHFRLQYALGAILTGFVFALFRKWFAVLAAVVVLVVNLSLIVPLYFFPDSLSISNPPVRVLLMNVLSSNQNTDAVIDQINRYQPNILALEEITPRWFAALSDQLRRDYPYQLHAVRDDNFGIWLLSRLPISSEEIIPWGNRQLPSATFRVRVGERWVRVVAMHPMSPGDPQGVRWRNAQLRQIAERFKASDEPLLVIGDLNTTSFAPVFQEFAQRLRLSDSRQGFGLQSSWPAFLLDPFMITLDHCLVSADWKVVHRETGDYTGSDHLPVYVEVDLR